MIEHLLKEAESLIKFKAYDAHSTLLSHCEIEDLEQEGRMAATRAAKKFRKERGVLLSIAFIF